jgi:hypothetical protein
VLDSIAFSSILWVFAPVLTRRYFERWGGIKITTRGLVVSFLSHLVYGAALGILLLYA